jgi:hypothetical protein
MIFAINGSELAEFDLTSVKLFSLPFPNPIAGVSCGNGTSELDNGENVEMLLSGALFMESWESMVWNVKT